MKMIAGIHMYFCTVKTTPTMISRKRGIDLRVRQFTALKLGYLKRENIMNERKSISTSSR